MRRLFFVKSYRGVVNNALLRSVLAGIQRTGIAAVAVFIQRPAPLLAIRLLPAVFLVSIGYETERLYVLRQA